eukprot:7757852-Ditylum_brightwellii.AAC.1
MTTTSTSDTTATNNNYLAEKNNLLMLSLPHHALPSDMMLKTFDLEYNCIKGKMKPVVGAEWSYNETLTFVDFDDEEAKQALSLQPSNNNTQHFNPTIIREILKQVQEDLTRVLPTLDENVYGFGKQVARLAQLVHIARRMNEVSSSLSLSNDLGYVVDQGADILHSFLTAFLTNKERDKLVYDANLGGMITLDGLKNTEADFGNGR